MNSADKFFFNVVTGYEANGGFMTNSIIKSRLTDNLLKALPTRDAVLPLLSVLTQSKIKTKKISGLLEELPERFTYSGILRNFSSDKGKSIIDYFQKEKEKAVIKFLSKFGILKNIDFTDGCRVKFDNNDILHLRPSGNAPEFRCYAESDNYEKAKIINAATLKIIENM